MDRVKKLLDNAAGNMLRVTFERGPNGEFSFLGISEPSKLKKDLPTTEEESSEMKESSSKESADSGFTEDNSEPLDQSVKKSVANEISEAQETKKETQQKKSKKKRARKRNKVAPIIEVTDDSIVERTEITVLPLGRNSKSRFTGKLPSTLLASTLPRIPEETPKTIFPSISDVKRSLVQADNAVCTKTKPDLDALFGKPSIHEDSDSRPELWMNTELPPENSKTPRNRLKLPSLFTKKKKTGKVTIPKELVGEDDEVTLLQSSFGSCPPKKGNVLPAKDSVPQPPAAKPNVVPRPPKNRNSAGQAARPLPFIKPKMSSAAKYTNTAAASKVQQKTAETTKVEAKPAKSAGVPSWWNDPIPNQRPKATCRRSDQPSDNYRYWSTARSYHNNYQEKTIRKTARDYHTFTWETYLPRFRAMDKPSRPLQPPKEKSFQRIRRPFGFKKRSANESDTKVEDLDL